MRLGVVDVGSNTVHFVAVDAEPGGRPTPMNDWKTSLRLVELQDKQGRISQKGIKKLCRAVKDAKGLSEETECGEFLPFATSAIRSAKNSAEILDEVEDQTGVRLQIISGVEEARLTFLAARRWYGWSAGRILGIDIGGGSLEIASGSEELPDAAFSLDLGASRLTHEWFDTDPPERKRVNELRDYIDEQLAGPAKELAKVGRPRVATGTSKTIRTLARLMGAAPSSAGPFVARELTAPGLRQLIAFLSRMSAADRAELEGVSSNRSHQIVAGALVAEATMRALHLDKIDICPWALREGVILRRIDKGLE